MLKILKDYVWTAEKLAIQDIKDLAIIRERAIARGNEELVSLCDAEIARKKPAKKVPSSTYNRGRPVKGIHLICTAEDGVVRNGDGTFWSGSWVIAKDRAEHGALINAYVALHEKQSEPSYLQGTIRAWRFAERKQLYADKKRQTARGIEFLVELTPTPLLWRGDGIIEKSYWYGDDEPPTE